MELPHRKEQSSGLFLIRGDLSLECSLHEQWEAVAEPLAFFSKQVGVGDAAGVQRVELNARVFVVAAVQLRNRHHVADLKSLTQYTRNVNKEVVARFKEC